MYPVAAFSALKIHRLARLMQVAWQVSFSITLAPYSIPRPSNGDNMPQNSLSTSIIGGQANSHRKPGAVTSWSAVRLLRRLGRPLLFLTLLGTPLYSPTASSPHSTYTESVYSRFTRWLGNLQTLTCRAVAEITGGVWDWLTDLPVADCRGQG